MQESDRVWEGSLIGRGTGRVPVEGQTEGNIVLAQPGLWRAWSTLRAGNRVIGGLVKGGGYLKAILVDHGTS